MRVLGLYNPRKNQLIADYLTATKGIFRGFSPAASGYLRFTVPLDPATLPASPAATLDPAASVQIIDIDTTSPEHGKRHLAETSWRRDEGVFWLSNTLAVAPALGYPLRPATRYAVVVTKKVRAEDGGELRPSDDTFTALSATPEGGVSFTVGTFDRGDPAGGRPTTVVPAAHRDGPGHCSTRREPRGR